MQAISARNMMNHMHMTHLSFGAGRSRRQLAMHEGSGIKHDLSIKDPPGP